MKRYLSEINKSSLLKRDEVNHLFEQYRQTNSQEIRNKLWKSNLRLVVSIAKTFHNSIKNSEDIELEDLVSEGNIGLLNGIEKFDHTRGFALSTYVSWWIKQAMRKYMKDKTVRLPEHVISLKNQIRKTIEEYKKEFNAEPTTEEVAEALDIDKEVVEKMKSNTGEIVHLQSGSNEEVHLSNTIVDYNASPFEVASSKELFRSIRETFKLLTKREEAIVRLRFGISESPADKENYGITQQELKQISSGKGLK